MTKTVVPGKSCTYIKLCSYLLRSWTMLQVSIIVLHLCVLRRNKQGFCQRQLALHSPLHIEKSWEFVTKYTGANTARLQRPVVDLYTWAITQRTESPRTQVQDTVASTKIESIPENVSRSQAVSLIQPDLGAKQVACCRCTGQAVP